MERPVPIFPERPRFRLGGRLRTSVEDFEVEELPLYAPTGAGDHVLAFIEKRGLTTPQMIERLARAVGANPRTVGCAGLKDRHAVTRQWISMEGVAPESLLQARVPGVDVLDAAAHDAKLRTGHLAGNRFRIVVRDPEPHDFSGLRAALEGIVRVGMPNAFGPQRFGSRGDNHLLGEALVKGDAELFMERATRVGPGDSETMQEARACLREGRHADAARLMPRGFGLERHLAVALRASGGSVEHAVRTISPRLKSLLVSAWQSEIFNAVLLRWRAESYGEILHGDVAMKHVNGACFIVEDTLAERARCVAGEISPTGPLPGRKMLQARGWPGIFEREELAARGATALEPRRFLKSKAFVGARRALRVPVRDASAERSEDGAVILGFTLPKGAFATSLLALLGTRDAGPDSEDRDRKRLQDVADGSPGSGDGPVDRDSRGEDRQTGE